MNKREQIVEAADLLFYQQGYEYTSFAQIAEQVGISRGNFYYHFKSKDHILDAVIARRVEATQDMLLNWQANADAPQERIEIFIDILLRNKSKILRYGCPVGSLTMELGKLDHPSKGQANALFRLFIEWLEKQFQQLGHQEESMKLAKHLLARTQGIATLASAFDDDSFIQSEVKGLKNWLAGLAV